METRRVFWSWTLGCGAVGWECNSCEDLNHIVGLDEDALLPVTERDEWQSSSDGIGGEVREPADFALLHRKPEPDRLGNLRAVIDPLWNANNAEEKHSLAEVAHICPISNCF